jgi:hypothetical protein
MCELTKGNISFGKSDISYEKILMLPTLDIYCNY